MKRLSNIIRVSLITILLTFSTSTAQATGFVWDMPRWMQDIKQGFEEAQSYIELIQIGYDQVNAIAHSNSIQDYIFNSASAVVYWAPDFAVLVNEAEAMYSLYDHSRNYIEYMVSKGDYSPRDASDALGELLSTIIACQREYQYITDVILNYDETISNTDRKKAVAEAAKNMFSYRFRFIIDQRGKQQKANTFDVTQDIYNNAKTLFSSQISKKAESDAKAALKTILDKEVNKNIKNANGEVISSFDEATGLDEGQKGNRMDPRIRIGILLIGLVGLAYLPYSLYKYNKGEKQAMDVMLKVYIGLFVGAVMLWLFGQLFLGPDKFNIVAPFVR